MNNTNEELIKLEAQVEVLLELPHTVAFTGTLGKNVLAKSYVQYSDVTKLLSEKRKLINKLKKK